MSIFPKRTVPGSQVTIHWNFNIAHLKDIHVCPWVRIGVKDPNGKTHMLFEDFVLGLPDPAEGDVSGLKYLNKNLPLLIIADYLSGAHRKEKLVEILQNIQSGRHFYFTFDLDDEAPLGRYSLISEVHSGGEVRYSKTAPDDYFLVEKVSVSGIDSSQESKMAIVENHSAEKTPVKIIGCSYTTEGKLKTQVNVFELDPFEKQRIVLHAPINYLSYNEERKIIPLQQAAVNILRNQQILQLDKADGTTYLLEKDGEEKAYTLTAEEKEFWLKADGLLTTSDLTEKEKKIHDRLVKLDFIKNISF